MEKEDEGSLMVTAYERISEMDIGWFAHGKACHEQYPKDNAAMWR